MHIGFMNLLSGHIGPKEKQEHLKQRIYTVLHTVTETLRNEHAPSQPFLLELTAGDENSVSAECAVCTRLNAFKAVSD